MLPYLWSLGPGVVLLLLEGVKARAREASHDCADGVLMQSQ